MSTRQAIQPPPDPTVGSDRYVADSLSSAEAMAAAGTKRSAIVVDVAVDGPIEPSLLATIDAVTEAGFAVRAVMAPGDEPLGEDDPDQVEARAGLEIGLIYTLLEAGVHLFAGVDPRRVRRVAQIGSQLRSAPGDHRP